MHACSAFIYMYYPGIYSAHVVLDFLSHTFPDDLPHGVLEKTKESTIASRNSIYGIGTIILEETLKLLFPIKTVYGN